MPQRSHKIPFNAVAAALTFFFFTINHLSGLERDPFNVPLSKISTAFDEESHSLEKVRLRYGDAHDHINITHFNDEFIKMTRRGRETRVYRETYERAWQMSDFEREQMYRVTESLIETLEGLERDLKRNNWGKLVYLDGFFPRFLRGYYFLHDAVSNSNELLPRVTRIPESAFDVSLNSPKSDRRINFWKDHAQQTMKLRIASKELANELDKWIHLSKRRRGDKAANYFFPEKLKRTYELFIRIYFNLKPPTQSSR